ncbi:MAG: DUF3379 family protein [Woeseiaceae bacterium]|nr:DUF3379 family protein [Woeseiaceae bacterium]
MDGKKFRDKVTGDSSTADSPADLDETSALDATLKRAMMLDVPELRMPELPEIETSKVVSLAERRRARAPVWLATAAAIMMAAVFGVYTYNASTSYDSLTDEIIAHMDHEPYALRVTDVPVNSARLERVVPASVANLSPKNGLITYAQSCEINGNTVPHLVVQGERGPVTIILLPDEKIDAATPFQGNNVNGVLIPVGDGSIAIIGEESAESMDRIRESFVDAASWRT